MQEAPSEDESQVVPSRQGVVVQFSRVRSQCFPENGRGHVQTYPGGEEGSENVPAVQFGTLGMQTVGSQSCSMPIDSRVPLRGHHHTRC